MIKNLLILCFCFFLLYSHAQDSINNQKDPIVILETNEGNITLKLFPNIAPIAVENFTTLVKSGYYDGLIFHRVIKKFMIQGGDPTGTGMGGESIWKKPFKDEFSPKVLFDKSGLLAMANSGRNTNGSQFFITTVPTHWLNGRHTIFGEVIDGMNIVKKIEASPSKNDRPNDKKYIIKAHLK